MSKPDYGAIGSTDEEKEQETAYTKDTPVYRFMKRWMKVMEFLSYDPIIAADFFDDSPDTKITATTVLALINVAVYYYWYILGGTKVRFRNLMVVFVLVYGSVYVVTRDMNKDRFPVLREHLLGDWFAPTTNTLMLLLTAISWALGYPFIEDFLADRLFHEAQLVQPLTRHVIHRSMIIWTSVFFGMSVTEWYSMLCVDGEPGAVLRGLPEVILVGGFVGQDLYTKYVRAHMHGIMERYTVEVAQWHIDNPHVEPPWGILGTPPREQPRRSSLT